MMAGDHVIKKRFLLFTHATEPRELHVYIYSKSRTVLSTYSYSRLICRPSLKRKQLLVLLSLKNGNLFEG